MFQIKVTIEGTTPLIMNRFTDHAQVQGEQGHTGAYRGDKGTPREQAEQKLYLGQDGKSIVIPQPNVFRCIIDGGCFFKVGRKMVTTKKESLIPAAVDMIGLEYLVIHAKSWEVDSRPVVIPATGGRIMCHRPRFDEWKLKFEVRLNVKLISLKLFREIVDAAGGQVGLGDFRPGRKGPFGKWVVIEWSAKELKSAA